jgi:hypothetical protein
MVGLGRQHILAGIHCCSIYRIEGLTSLTFKEEIMVLGVNLADQTFNRWKVKSYSHMTVRGKRYWHCVCACGTERAVAGGDLVGGHSKSCGCLQRPPEGFAYKEEPRYEYVPVCKERIDFMLKAEPDYFKRDTHTSLFETFIYLTGAGGAYRH